MFLQKSCDSISHGMHESPMSKYSVESHDHVTFSEEIHSRIHILNGVDTLIATYTAAYHIYVE